MSFQAAIFDELTPVYPDTKAVDGYAEYDVSGCNGTVIGAHIVLNGLEPGLPVTVEVQGQHRCFKWFKLLPVPVEVNCGAEERTEYTRGDVNPNVIRRAPFMVYEVLDPFYNIFTPQFAHAAIAFKTPIEYCRQSRERVWILTIRQGEAAQTLTLRVKEFSATVPKAGANTFKYINWFDFDRIAIDFHCEKWSGRYFKVLEQYLRAAVFSRQNTLRIRPAEVFDLTDDKRALLNEKRLDEIIRVAKRAGIALFHGGVFAVRQEPLDDDAIYASLDHDTISTPEEVAERTIAQISEAFVNGCEARVAVTGEALPGKDGEATLRSMAGQLYAYIQKNNMADIWYQSLMDEPTVTFVPLYCSIREIVKSVMPGITIFEPVLEFETLKGMIDIWCTTVDQYERNKAFYTERVAEGNRVWAYSCLTPAGNWCNRMLDMERLRAVWVFWAPIVHPDIDGFLHWGGNSIVPGGPFRRQAGGPFKENVLEFHPKHVLFLPAGDSAIFFPGDDGPLISTRSEAHRIGHEDLHLLKLLEAKSPNEARALVNRVFRGFDDFEKDVKVYRETRRRLLELL